EVEQDQVGPRGPRQPQADRAVAGFADDVARRREVVLERLADAVVVLDDQDAVGHPSSTTCPDSRKTMSSATLVTRSPIRSRLWATWIRVTARSASSVSVPSVPSSSIRSSKIR